MWLFITFSNWTKTKSIISLSREQEKRTVDAEVIEKKKGCL